MTKYSHLLGICCALLLGGCQTVEQLSIDYMLPAEVSFPPILKRVAVVNNMPSIPDNKLIVEETDEKKKDWKTSSRYLFTSGSVNMRDAAVYVRENNWQQAIELWKQTYEKKKKGKQKMYAAYNVALGYEMQDSIQAAEEWALKAQKEAYDIDKIEEKKEQGGIDISDVPNYFAVTRYLNELQERKEGMTRLNVQMERFKNDF